MTLGQLKDELQNVYQSMKRNTAASLRYAEYQAKSILSGSLVETSGTRTLEKGKSWDSLSNLRRQIDQVEADIEVSRHHRALLPRIKRA